MKLPKLKLPNLSIIVSLFLIFSILAPNIVAYAQASTPDTPSQPVAVGTTQPATAGSTVASDEKGQVKWLWVVVGIGASLLLTELLTGGVSGTIDCITDFHKCVEGAAALTQNFVYKQNIGCDFAKPTENGDYSGGDEASQCHQEKMKAIAAGRPDPHPGALTYAGTIVNSALKLPVPISTSQYFASINPFKRAQAQGFAGELQQNTTLLEIWQKVRQASYALLVVILVVVGFMIMIRFPLGPRNVVTLQNSLPKIAISLLLITFSFAIAGLMVDLARVLTSFAWELIPGPDFNITAIILSVIASLFALGAMPLAVFGAKFTAIALLLIGLIIIAIVVVVFINLIFKIITRYAIFLLLAIFSPLFFLIGALPGAEGVILTWFRRTAAALLAIPATAFVIKLSFVIGFSEYITGDRTPLPGIWIVPNPIHTVLEWAILGPVIGLGLFFFATKVPDIVDEMFGNRPLAPRAGIGPGAILGAPFAGFMLAGNIGRAWKGTAGMREAAARWTMGRGFAGPRPQGPTQIPRGIPAERLSPDWRKFMEKEKLLTTTEEGEVVTAGGEVTPAAPREGGPKAAVARFVSRIAGPAVGVPPPGKPIVKTPEQLEEEERRRQILTQTGLFKPQSKKPGDQD